jgi:two-component system, NtrC family, sensor histidine kinase PilS
MWADKPSESTPASNEVGGLSRSVGFENRFDLTLIVFSRTLMFAALYGVTNALDASPTLRMLANAYGLVTIAFLVLVAISSRRKEVRPRWALFLQLLVEVPLETAIVWQGGGYLGDYGLLYILTILVGGLFLPVAGVFALTSLVALLFGFIGLVQMGWVPALRHALPEVPTDWIQIRFFLFTTLFYAVALLAAQGSRRLLEVKRRLEGTERALDLQQFRFAHILHELPSGVLFFDAAFNLQYWNPVVEAWFKNSFRKGVALEEVMEGLLDPESLQAMRLDGPLFPFTEMELIAPDGRPLHMQYKALLQDGTFQGSVFILLDFTRENRWKATLVHQERLAAVGRLAAGIAHEIRNPLASITGSAQMLEDWPGLPESERTLLRLITHESKRLNRLLSDLLGYVRERRVQRRPLSIASVLAEVELAVRNHSKFDASQIEITCESPAPDPAFASDPDLLHRVLLNLGLNALEALVGQERKAGDPKGRIAFTASIEGETLRLDVADNGPGLAEDVMLHAFEPFFTTKTEGTGLGLATCQQDVQILGGSINLSTPPGSGALVTIRLPILVEAGDSEKHGYPPTRIRKVAHS